MSLLTHWQFWALLSAAFAAATALLSKAGLRGVDADVAQLVRTLVVVAVLAFALSTLGKLKEFPLLTQRNWIFLTLAGLATAASWACYFRSADEKRQNPSADKPHRRRDAPRSHWFDDDRRLRRMKGA